MNVGKSERIASGLLRHAQHGEFDPSFLVTHRFSLEDAPRGYEMFRSKEEGCVRAVFVP